MRKWKILYWENEELGAEEKIFHIKMDNIEEVIKFCQLKHLISYCIFDDLGLNVYTFGNGKGQYNLIPKESRQNAIREKEKNER